MSQIEFDQFKQKFRILMRRKREHDFAKTKSRFSRLDELLSPRSSEKPSEIQAPQTSGRQLMERVNDNMLSNMKIKFLLNILIKKLKYLSPPLELPDNVEEEWESKIESEGPKEIQTNNEGKETFREELYHRYEHYKYLNLLEGVVLLLFCWIVTVSVVFQIKIAEEIIILELLISLIRIGFLGSFMLREKDTVYRAYYISLFDDLLNPILILLACSLFVVRFYADLGLSVHLVEVLGLATVGLQYKYLEFNFREVIKYAEKRRMKKELRILSLFLLIITLAHFFGLVMFGMTYLAPGERNWVGESGLEGREWHIQYIYCFYWAITTMVTVGYGDLTPSNHVEVMIITAIQLVGTAIFGYMINVIGITVDEIKKKNEEFDNYQETIHKLRDHYQLSRELCHKMRHDIRVKENELRNIPLKTSEEIGFLNYIQPTLREEFVLETNMRVIKKSIFFLTHFSVNFQNEIALKLIRIIYKPEEEIRIADPATGERNLVIINSGCAEIFIQKAHSNTTILKKVREIKPSDDGLVMNVFGYSSLIMNRDIRLRAVASETAVTYVLKRKDVMECIDKSMLDFESFNELREKMINYRFLEEVEAPSLKEQEKHFVPNIFVMQKKITNENQGRAYCSRDRRRLRLELSAPSKLPESRTFVRFEDDNSRALQSRKMLHEEDFHSISDLSSRNADEATFALEEDGILGKVKMDQCKVFENFMKSSNMPAVAAAYDKACRRTSYRKRMRTSLFGKPGSFIPNMVRRQKQLDSLH